MTENTVIDFARPSDFSPDPLTDVLRQGARELLATAVRAEVSEFIASHANFLDDEGRQRHAGPAGHDGDHFVGEGRDTCGQNRPEAKIIEALAELGH